MPEPRRRRARRRCVRVNYVQLLRSSRARTRRGEGSGAHCGHVEANGAVGDGLTTSGGSRRSRSRGGEVEGAGGDAGRSVLPDSAERTRRRDGAAGQHGKARGARWLRGSRRRELGSVGHGGGEARERCRGRMGVSGRSSGRRRSTSASSGAGGKQVAPWRARARWRHLSACSGKRKQLTGAGQHSAGPASGLPGKILSLSLFCFVFPIFL